MSELEPKQAGWNLSRKALMALYLMGEIEFLLIAVGAFVLTNPSREENKIWKFGPDVVLLSLAMSGVMWVILSVPFSIAFLVIRRKLRANS